MTGTKNNARSIIFKKKMNKFKIRKVKSIPNKISHILKKELVLDHLIDIYILISYFSATYYIFII